MEMSISYKSKNYSPKSKFKMYKKLLNQIRLICTDNPKYFLKSYKNFLINEKIPFHEKEDSMRVGLVTIEPKEKTFVKNYSP